MMDKMQKKVKKVMKEYKSGKLKSGSGAPVKSRKQAVAIAMSESGQAKTSRVQDSSCNPGGFVEYGESLEMAAVREAKEETSLDIEIVEQFHTYSDPGRDPRFHTITTVFIATAQGRPHARDDARNVGIFTEEDRPRPLAFDHERILADYRSRKNAQRR